MNIHVVPDIAPTNSYEYLAPIAMWYGCRFLMMCRLRNIFHFHDLAVDIDAPGQIITPNEALYMPFCY